MLCNILIVVFLFQVLQSLEDIQHDINCKISEILAALQVFQQSIVDLAVAFHQGSSLNVATETSFGHLWKLKDGNFPSGNDRCLCGQFSADNTDISWKMFTKCSYQMSDVVNVLPLKYDKKIEKSVILDELSSKINAYSLAFHTAASLLRVSILVHS